MGNYQIEIAALNTGEGIIGASNIRRYAGQIVDRAHVYGIQIGHRVVASTPDGPRIMTPTAAFKAGYSAQRFPGPCR